MGNSHRNQSSSSASTAARQAPSRRGSGGKRKQATENREQKEQQQSQRQSSIKRLSGGMAKRKSSAKLENQVNKKKQQVANIISPIGNKVRPTSPTSFIDQTGDASAKSQKQARETDNIIPTSGSQVELNLLSDECDKTEKNEENTTGATTITTSAKTTKESHNKLADEKFESEKLEDELEFDRETRVSSTQSSLAKLKSVASKSRENIAVGSGNESQTLECSSFGRKFFPFGSGSLMQKSQLKSQTRNSNADVSMARKPLGLLSRSTSFYVTPVNSSLSNSQSPQTLRQLQQPQTAMAIARANIKALLGVGSTSGTATPVSLDPSKSQQQQQQLQSNTPNATAGHSARQLVSSSQVATSVQQQSLRQMTTTSQQSQELLTVEQRKRIRNWLDSQPPIGTSGGCDPSFEWNEEFGWSTPKPPTLLLEKELEAKTFSSETSKQQELAGKEKPPLDAQATGNSIDQEDRSSLHNPCAAVAQKAGRGSGDGGLIMEMESIEELTAPTNSAATTTTATDASLVTWSAEVAPPDCEQREGEEEEKRLHRQHLKICEDNQLKSETFKESQEDGTEAVAKRSVDTRKDFVKLSSSTIEGCRPEVGAALLKSSDQSTSSNYFTIISRPKSASVGGAERLANKLNRATIDQNDQVVHRNITKTKQDSPPVSSTAASSTRRSSSSSSASFASIPFWSKSRLPIGEGGRSPASGSGSGSSRGSNAVAVSSDQSARSSLLEFRLPVADDKCSLCHYLISIREMAQRKPNTPAAPTSPSFECHRRPRSRFGDVDKIPLSSTLPPTTTALVASDRVSIEHHQKQQLTPQLATAAAATTTITNELPPEKSPCKSGDATAEDNNEARSHESKRQATMTITATSSPGSRVNKIEGSTGGATGVSSNAANQVEGDDIIGDTPAAATGAIAIDEPRLVQSQSSTFGFERNLAHPFSNEESEFCCHESGNANEQQGHRQTPAAPPPTSSPIGNESGNEGGSRSYRRVALRNTRGLSLDGHRGPEKWQYQRYSRQLHSGSPSSYHARLLGRQAGLGNSGGRGSRDSNDRLSQSNKSFVSSKLLVISSNNVSYAIQLTSQGDDNESGDDFSGEHITTTNKENCTKNNSSNNNTRADQRQQVGQQTAALNKIQVIAPTYGDSVDCGQIREVATSVTGTRGRRQQGDVKLERKLLCGAEHRQATRKSQNETGTTTPAIQAKKFLVKKISNSNIKDFIKKQQIKQQANLTRRKLPPNPNQFSSSQLTSSNSSPSFPQYQNFTSHSPVALSSAIGTPVAPSQFSPESALASSLVGKKRASGPPSVINSEESEASLSLKSEEYQKQSIETKLFQLELAHKQMDKSQTDSKRRPKTAESREASIILGTNSNLNTNTNLDTNSKPTKDSLLLSAGFSHSIEAAMNSLQAAKMVDHHQSIDHRSLMDSVRLNWQASQDSMSAGNPNVVAGSGAVIGNTVTISDEATRSAHQAAKRLRELTAHLEHGSVPRSVLYETLEFATSVLDSVAMDQISNRVSDEEDGDLSEVQSDAVPNEVRKWLETTFTRNSISQKRKSEDKLKFRSVANAIRAGIVVDRIYRRMSASTPFISNEVSSLLKSIDDWSFNCFNINQASNGQVLKSIGYELFNRYGLMYKFKIPTTTLKNFLTQIESGYTKHKNPYHNNLHAADVTQTVHHLLWQAGLTNWLTDLEIFATLLAAIIHDYLHTGTTNNFHVMSQSDTALLYNDRAVLENFHICQAFTLMRNEDCNILAGLSKDEFREFRSLVIDMVLATDMSSHFQQIKAMKNILNHSDNFSADKSKILSLVIHISDISHPAKEWELHSQWTGFLMEEFFRQGDREKELNLECSPLCDRETTLVAESQLGFIEFIVSPSLEICGDVLDRVQYQMAEANTRPVLPASAKTASIVTSTSMKAITAGSDQIQEKAESAPAAVSDQQAGRKLSGSQVSVGSSSQSGSGAGGGSNLNSTSSGSSSSQSGAGSGGGGGVGGTSFASSFVSSETLTSNLRKMIVSSSATLGRKLTNLGSSQQQAGGKNGGGGDHTSITSSTNTSTNANEGAQSAAASAAAAAAAAERDFEVRQANYQHPVIRCNPSSRQKSSASTVYRQQQQGDAMSQLDNKSSGSSGVQQEPASSNEQLMESRGANSRGAGEVSASNERRTHGAPSPAANSTDSNQQQQQLQTTTSITTTATSGGGKQLDRLAAQPGDLANAKRTSNSSLHLAGPATSRSAPPLHYVKIQRPWIKCLERNKRMWQERALVDAEARHAREKLKQKAIQEVATRETTGGEGSDNNNN